MPADRASDVYDLEVDIQARRIRFLELLFDSVVATHAGGGAADTHPHVLTLRRGDDIVLRWAFADREDCRHNAGRILRDLERLTPERFAAEWLTDSTSSENGR